jgi:hypothetical protein
MECTGERAQAFPQAADDGNARCDNKSGGEDIGQLQENVIGVHAALFEMRRIAHISN